eukprot:scaffold178804_cov24-Tisochrysis_lutea.AAC.1
MGHGSRTWGVGVRGEGRAVVKVWAVAEVAQPRHPAPPPPRLPRGRERGRGGSEREVPRSH